VGLQLGDHQKYETRTVRGSSSPVFNEYFELLVRDPLKERLEVRVESKDLLMSDKIGLIRLPITQIARGKVLQEWMPLSDKSSSQILLEIRLCNFEYESQERTPQTRFDMLLEKAARMEAEAAPFQPAVVKTTDSKEPQGAGDVADQVVN
jgi:Ca2+-dependent lipid-binding protein